MIAMTAPDTFRLNAYRVLRLSASATAADIQKAAANMKRADAHGVSGTAAMDIPGLGEVPRGAANIDAAVRRLSNPVHRLADRLFWFCQLPAPSGAQRLSSAMDPTGHDSVLRALFQAMHGGLDESGLAAWVDALSAWRALTCDDDYWYLTLIYEDQGGFESPATPEEVEALRADAVRLAACPLLFAARTALETGEKDTIRRVLTALSSLTHTGPWASAAIREIEEDLATPEIDRCRELHVR
jgi:hypothetical protein